MKKTIQFAVLLTLTSLLTGCASAGGYFVDRGRDAADIFTAKLGVGAGAKARVGPVSLGLVAQADVFGLRGGSIQMRQYRDPGGGNFAFGDLDLYGVLVGFEEFSSGNSIVGKRNKDYNAETKYPFVMVPSSSRLTYCTQIEVSGGLLGTVRLGFNPGELLDFIFGWATIDIFDDDLCSRKEEWMQREEERRIERKSRRKSNKTN